MNEKRKGALKKLDEKGLPCKYEDIVFHANVPYEDTIRKLLRHKIKRCSWHSRCCRQCNTMSKMQKLKKKEHTCKLEVQTSQQHRLFHKLKTLGRWQIYFTNESETVKVTALVQACKKKDYPDYFELDTFSAAKQLQTEYSFEGNWWYIWFKNEVPVEIGSQISLDKTILWRKYIFTNYKRGSILLSEI